MDVTVAVATYGSRTWMDLADERAIPSAESQGVPVVYVHGDTLHEARNEALDKVNTEFVCFLDADDELERNYFTYMDKASADLRAPAVRYVKENRPAWPRVPRVAGHSHRCTADCLTYGNWLVIGTVAPTQMVHEVGGFRDFEWSEDYDLWVRCWQAGATVEAVPEAVYRAHVRPDSRNRAPDRLTRLGVHQAIARANGLPIPA